MGLLNNWRNMNIIISIIVPVYNVEKYLDKCIKSLINQTYKDIEIILVDDGSTDNSPAVCDKYSVIDKRISTIHKTNGGTADARNAGLINSYGEYILFVDSDDYIELDACEKLISIAKDTKADIILGNAVRIEKNKTHLICHKFDNQEKPITGREFLKYELRHNNNVIMSVWLNMYNRKFLLNNNHKFKKGLYHEDELFTPIVILSAKSVIASDIIFYNYLIRKNSITTSKNKTKNAESILYICRYLEKKYAKLEDKKLTKLLNNHLVNLYLNIFQVAKLHRKEYAYLIDKKLLKGKSYTIVNKLRVALFYISIKAYYYINFIRHKLLNFFSFRQSSKL